MAHLDKGFKKRSHIIIFRRWNLFVATSEKFIARIVCGFHVMFYVLAMQYFNSVWFPCNVSCIGNAIFYKVREWVWKWNFARLTDSNLRMTTYRLTWQWVIGNQGGPHLKSAGGGGKLVGTRNPVRFLRSFLSVSI